MLGRLLCKLGLHWVYKQTPAFSYCLREHCSWEHMDMEKLARYEMLKHWYLGTGDAVDRSSD